MQELTLTRREKIALAVIKVKSEMPLEELTLFEGPKIVRQIQTPVGEETMDELVGRLKEKGCLDAHSLPTQVGIDALHKSK